MSQPLVSKGLARAAYAAILRAVMEPEGGKKLNNYDELNLESITIEDAELLYRNGKHIVVSDGKVVGIEEER